LYYSNSGSRKIGADFSKNLVDNLELHGEYCYSDNLSRTAVFNNLLTSKTVNDQSYLIGFRWLNSLNTTIIGEYYYNDNGLSKEEYNNYLGYMESVENSANTSAIRTALNISQNYFSDNNLMKKYFYIKAIQPEPFNWLYFTPSVYFIYSIEDESFMNGVNLLYKPFTNLEFQFTSILTVGSRDSQFGTKENKNKLEILSRFYF